MPTATDAPAQAVEPPRFTTPMFRDMVRPARPEATSWNRLTALRVFYDMWFEARAERGDDYQFTVKGTECLIRLHIADLLHRGRAYFAASQDKAEPFREWNRLLHAELILAADAYSELLRGDRAMFRLTMLEWRRAREAAREEHANIRTAYLALVNLQFPVGRAA